MPAVEGSQTLGYNRNMSIYTSFFDNAGSYGLSPMLDALPGQLARAFDLSSHGDLGRWQEVLGNLPVLQASHVDFDDDIPSIGSPSDSDAEIRQAIEMQLRQLHPWRKGPYRIHGTLIDSEWRSDMKWRRLHQHLACLRGRVVLDVGCGNGYHCWRMLGAGARMVLGIDPTLLSVIQFQAVKHFAGEFPVHVLPLGIEDMPKKLNVFDTVFSMGVLYHRRSPLDHLLELRNLIRAGGELVLETLVIDGGAGEVLVPEGRYARMRNVWFIPSCLMLEGWLKRCGYSEIRLIDVTRTTPSEQRATDWMRFQSLQDCLHPNDPSLTVEGLPSPKRAIILALSM
jgi:tRNA (mo5U34)-methyltransferase